MEPIQKKKWQGSINTSRSAAGASGSVWIRSRKPPQHASCESWSMPQRNPIKCKILLKVNQGHAKYHQYYCHFSRVKWFRYWIQVLNFISRRADLFLVFLNQNRCNNLEVLLHSHWWPGKMTWEGKNIGFIFIVWDSLWIVMTLHWKQLPWVPLVAVSVWLFNRQDMRDYPRVCF